MQIGGAGQEEYIDSTVECFDVRCSIAAGGAPYTNVSFREVEESWKFDSSETARMIASGGFNRRPSQNAVTIAAQYYPGYADYYCDGTNDQEEINSALAYRGEVQLTPGTFNLTSSIAMTDNTKIIGWGPQTIITNAASGFWCIQVTGQATSYMENIEINNLTFIDQDGSGGAIALEFVKDFAITNCHMKNCISAVNMSQTLNGIVANNISDMDSDFNTDVNLGAGIFNVYQMEAHQSGNIGIVNNQVINHQASGFESGLLAGIMVNASSTTGIININNNIISNIQCTASGGSNTYGIWLYDGTNINVSSNKVEQMKSSSGTAYGIYIATAVTSAIVLNNYCYNNGADTGFANTNRNNLYDAGTDTQWAG